VTGLMGKDTGRRPAERGAAFENRCLSHHGRADDAEGGGCEAPIKTSKNYTERRRERQVPDRLAAVLPVFT